MVTLPLKRGAFVEVRRGKFKGRHGIVSVVYRATSYAQMQYMIQLGPDGPHCTLRPTSVKAISEEEFDRRVHEG